MKIAVTGGSGRIGSTIVRLAVADGHEVVSLDRVNPTGDLPPGVEFVLAEATDYDALVAAFAGCDAVIHMAAIPSPGRHPDHVVHNNNVVGSYNALRAAAEHGILRVSQASSVNAIGHSFSRHPRSDYFPIDEAHPNYDEDPSSLSKWICEKQAESFVRRYEGMTIASLRFHWVVADRETALARYIEGMGKPRNHLWCYTLLESAARAALLGVTADFTGHEAFFIIAPRIGVERPSRELAAEHVPDVPIRGEFASDTSFFSSAKAERLLGWRHE